MNIEAVIRKFLTENFILKDAENVGEEDSLLEKGIIDSTGVLELVAYIEENFAITVEDEEMIPENLDSIKNIVEFIQCKMKGLAESKSPEFHPSPSLS